MQPSKVQEAIEKAIAFVRDNQVRLQEIAAEKCDPRDTEARARKTNAADLLRSYSVLEADPNNIPARAQILIKTELWHVFHKL